MAFDPKMRVFCHPLPSAARLPVMLPPIIPQSGLEDIRGEVARQAAVQMRLEFEGQAYDCYQDWCRREAEAYHTIIKYLSPTVSAQVAGIGTSREL